VGSDSLCLRRLAVLAMLVSALALGGCGRRGPLELPPSATPEQRAAAGDPRVAPPAVDAEGNPIAGPDSRKRKSSLDWLID
jgi:predicted small lipoprotein YifL